MPSIAKLCATHLRSIANDNDIKIKSSHSHELVAAFFGYKSQAAMLADNLFSIENINKVGFIFPMPLSFIQERCKSLNGLPQDLLNIDALTKKIFDHIKSKLNLSCYIYTAWEQYAKELSQRYISHYADNLWYSRFDDNVRLRDRIGMPRYKFKPMNEFNPMIKFTDSSIYITTTNRYHCSFFKKNSQYIDIKVTIKLLRISGYVGYAQPNATVSEITNQSCA